MCMQAWCTYVHTEAPAADFWLVPQSVQVVWPSPRKVPAGQALQSLMSSEPTGEEDPRAQALHNTIHKPACGINGRHA